MLRERGDDFASDVRQLARNGGDSSQIESLASKKAFTDQVCRGRTVVKAL